MNTRGGSWKELVKRLDNEAVSAYKKSQTTHKVATKPPIVSKAKPKTATTISTKDTVIVNEKMDEKLLSAYSSMYQPKIEDSIKK